MKLGSFVLSAVALTIQYYAEKYEKDDLARTLEELEGDFGLPRIKVYDYIVGKPCTRQCTESLMLTSSLIDIMQLGLALLAV